METSGETEKQKTLVSWREILLVGLRKRCRKDRTRVLDKEGPPLTEGLRLRAGRRRRGKM